MGGRGAARFWKGRNGAYRPDLAWGGGKVCFPLEILQAADHLANKVRSVRPVFRNLRSGKYAVYIDGSLAMERDVADGADSIELETIFSGAEKDIVVALLG